VIEKHPLYFLARVKMLVRLFTRALGAVLGSADDVLPRWNTSASAGFPLHEIVVSDMKTWRVISLFK
jgi:hypothetical protein